MKKTPEELQQRIDAAKTKYTFPWWDAKDLTQVFWGQLNEPVLLVEWDKFHAAAEHALGRPVWTHEFADPQSLKNEFQNRIPKATFEDVLAKIPCGKAVIVV